MNYSIVYKLAMERKTSESFSHIAIDLFFKGKLHLEEKETLENLA